MQNNTTSKTVLPINAVIAPAIPATTLHRTFHVSLSSLYEIWQLTTFLGWAGEQIQPAGEGFRTSFELGLTVRPGTLELPELRWLLEHFFDVADGGQSLLLLDAQAPLAARHPNPRLLEHFAGMVHSYLDAYDVAAMLKSLEHPIDRAMFEVATRTIPSFRHNPQRFNQHMRICMDCVRLTYADDSFLL